MEYSAISPHERRVINTSADLDMRRKLMKPGSMYTSGVPLNKLHGLILRMHHALQCDERNAPKTVRRFRQLDFEKFCLRQDEENTSPLAIVRDEECGLDPIGMQTNPQFADRPDVRAESKGFFTKLHTYSESLKNQYDALEISHGTLSPTAEKSTAEKESYESLKNPYDTPKVSHDELQQIKGNIWEKYDDLKISFGELKKKNSDLSSQYVCQVSLFFEGMELVGQTACS